MAHDVGHFGGVERTGGNQDLAVLDNAPQVVREIGAPKLNVGKVRVEFHDRIVSAS